MARKSTRQLWADKILGKSTQAKSLNDASLSFSKPAYHGRILGIDPSLRGMGIALVEFNSGEGKLCASKTLKLSSSLTMAQCLGRIAGTVKEFMQQGELTHVAMEETIYVQNFKTAQIMGAARGAAIATVAMEGVHVYEYPPLRIKQSVVGFGRASKEQMSKMVKVHLKLQSALPFDESDAAGVALCHAFTWRKEK